MTPDELGAHVSIAGGVLNAPGRAAERGTRVMQVFTKMANRWAEPEIDAATAAAFKCAREKHHIWFAAAHDSYLINLATSDDVLYERSRLSFAKELERCHVLQLDALVTHPGNATGGDAAYGLARNADAVGQLLTDRGGNVAVLFETTAGAGTALGARFEQLAELIERLGPELSDRAGVCLDTCHVWAAGYDIAGSYDDVLREFDDVVGLGRIRLFHLNDSAGGLGSRRDRHAHIGTGAIGSVAFRRLLEDARFAHVPKVIETPKDDDVLATDLMNLAALRGFRAKRSESA